MQQYQPGCCQNCFKLANVLLILLGGKKYPPAPHTDFLSVDKQGAVDVLAAHSIPQLLSCTAETTALLLLIDFVALLVITDTDAWVGKLFLSCRLKQWNTS